MEIIITDSNSDDDHSDSNDEGRHWVLHRTAPASGPPTSSTSRPSDSNISRECPPEARRTRSAAGNAD